VTLKSRVVTVKGRLGELTKRFKHVSMELFQKEAGGKKFVGFRMWLATRKQAAVVRTIRTQVSNMIRGVTTGYKFKMVLAYSHFPIHVNILDNGRALEIKNFLGIKMNRRIDCLPTVTVDKKEEEKNILTFQSIDLTAISLTCALVRQSCKIPEKDLRQFLDGIYVSEKRLPIQE
jgi:large subunit ribosomal protein L9e